MPRLNYAPRKRTPKPKRPFAEIQQERVNQLLDLIMAADELLEYDAIKKLGWGPGVIQTTGRIINSAYSDLVEWHKKTRTWKSVPLDPEKLVSEQVISKPLEVLQTE